MKKACPVCGSRSNYDEEQNHCFSCGITKGEMLVGGMYFDASNNQIVSNKKDLRCCGNCNYLFTVDNRAVCTYQKPLYDVSPHVVCDKWEFDGLTYDGRKV